jgi:hypothetical protein
MADLPLRPPALVLSGSDPRRRRACRLLESLGYDPLGFSSNKDAEAWLEEDTPEAAIVDGPCDRELEVLFGVLRARNVDLIALDGPPPQPSRA